MVLGLALFFFVAFVVTLGLLLFSPQRTASTPAHAAHREAERLRAMEGDAERRRRETEEAKALVNELRAELKQTKRKLHEQRTAERSDQDLVRARTEVERAASQQLEVVRGELAHALAELSKLRADAEGNRAKGRASPLPAPAPQAPPPPPPQSTVPAAASLPDAERAARRFRELSDSDKEKLERLEHQANRERTRALEFQTEVRRLKGRTETQHRVWVVTKGELDLLKDKFKALEKRLNRTLLERDLLKRALGELERRGGLTAGRTELTQEEIALSDRGVEERSRAEAERLERRTQAAQPTPGPAEANGTVASEALRQPVEPGPAAVPAEQESAS
ncbi:MAG: cell envelope biogenesis protein TolA [Myxococcaceae bacterium]